MSRALILLAGALLYVLWPFDIVPDFLAFVGWIDDLLVAALSIYFTVQALKKKIGSGPPGGRAPRPRGPIIDTDAEPVDRRKPPSDES